MLKWWSLSDIFFWLTFFYSTASTTTPMCHLWFSFLINKVDPAYDHLILKNCNRTQKELLLLHACCLCSEVSCGKEEKKNIFIVLLIFCSWSLWLFAMMVTFAWMLAGIFRIIHSCIKDKSNHVVLYFVWWSWQSCLSTRTFCRLHVHNLQVVACSSFRWFKITFFVTNICLSTVFLMNFS